MNVNWKSASKGQIPEGAIVSGFESNGVPLFLCRADTRRGVHPGKVRLEFGAANIGISRRELKVDDYEVYCGGAKWMKASNGSIPDGAIVVGHESNGAQIFAARAKFSNGLHPGKIRRAFNGALIPWGDKENLIKEYEVLVEK